MKIQHKYKRNIEMSFRQYCKAVKKYLLDRYFLKVCEKEVVDSNEYIGSFDGKKITIKNDLNNQHKLFLIAHLFGHCVQWCGLNSDKYADIEMTLPINNEGKISEEQLNRLRRYELEAAGYAIQLLDDALNENLSQWFSDWSHADWDYFTKILSLKNKPEVIDLKVVNGTELIPSREIPSIQLRKITPKYAY